MQAYSDPKGERCEVCGAPAVRGSGNLALAVCAKHEARECRCGGVIVPDGCDTFSDGDTLHAVDGCALHAVNDCEATSRALMLATTAHLLASIEGWQAVQKANPPASQRWRAASAVLRPLFAEMARRQRGRS